MRNQLFAMPRPSFRVTPQQQFTEKEWSVHTDTPSLHFCCNIDSSSGHILLSQLVPSTSEVGTRHIIRTPLLDHTKTGPAYNWSARTTYGCHNWSPPNPGGLGLGLGLGLSSLVLMQATLTYGESFMAADHLWHDSTS